CPKSEGMIEWEYAEDRLLSPMRKVNGAWQEISWEEAFDFIAGRLQTIKERDGAKAVAVHMGNPFVATHVEKVARRFFDLYGTPNYTTGSSFCFYARTLGHSLTLEYGRVNAGPNYRDTRCTIVWGSNPEESAHLQFLRLKNLKRETGLKIIVVDPRRTNLAKLADIHARVRPGADAALALGLLHVIIEEKLYDAAFVERWTSGFDKLVTHVRDYTPEKVAAITWVPADTVRDIARAYATAKPANIAQGIATDHSVNGVQCSRATAVLMAITGNVDIPGGNTWPGKIALTNLRIPGRVDDKDGISTRQYPLFSQFTLEQTAVCLPDAILEGKPYPIKAMVVQGSNPALIWPNTSRTIEALNKLELLVVIDLFMTETAKQADIVLPSATFLEQRVFKDYRNLGIPLLLVGQKAVEPRGNCKADWKIWAELGRRMGWGEYFPWQDDEQLIGHLLEPSGITLEQFKEKPGGIFAIRPEFQRYLKAGKFGTPSGKVEIYSETMAQHGYDPLPSYREPPESPYSTPELAARYPFILITGPRTRYYTHSAYRSIPALRRQVPEPLLTINARAAGELGIADGDMVAVESPRGRIELRASVVGEGEIDPRVVSIQHGWDEANANRLTDDKARDPVSGYPAFRTGLCRVNKLASGGKADRPKVAVTKTG
ncbi:MAG: molybdopterin-dependent oxidoreductase, partial [Chloroflexota bacterium]